jgi:hypothetical protein
VNDFKKAFLEISRIGWVTGISSIWPEVRLLSVSGIRPDIWQVKSDSFPDTGYQNRPVYPAGYPSSRISGGFANDNGMCSFLVLPYSSQYLKF